MKRIVQCLVMLFFAASMAFAGGGGQKAGSGKNLVLYTEYSGDSLEFVKRKAQEFCAANPGVSIEVITATSGQSFDTIFKTAVAGNEKIDIVQVNIQFYRDYVTRGFLQPIESYVDLSKLPIIDMAWEQEAYFSRKNQKYGFNHKKSSGGSP